MALPPELVDLVLFNGSLDVIYSYENILTYFARDVIRFRTFKEAIGDGGKHANFAWLLKINSKFEDDYKILIYNDSCCNARVKQRAGRFRVP